MNKISLLAEQALQPGSGHRIPPEAYYSQEWQDKEDRALFEKVWNFAGVVIDLPNPGDYLTIKVGRAPILVVRDRENQIRAFHNFCRHRGAQLLDGKGHCATISCPYHAWNYGLDGQLRKVPHHEEQFADMKLEDWPLLPAHCEVHAGMIFVNVSDKPASLTEWLGELGVFLNQFDVSKLVELQTIEHPLKSNWKYFAENHIDWLHLFYLHAKTLNMYDHTKGHWTQCGDHWMGFEVPEPTKIDEVVQRQEGMLPIEGIEPQEGYYGAHLLFPNIPLITSDKSFTIMELKADGPTRSKLFVRLFAMEGSVLPDTRKEDSKVMQEDQLAAERMQMTVESPFTTVGPLASEYEAPVTDFHDSYLRYLDVS